MHSSAGCRADGASLDGSAAVTVGVIIMLLLRARRCRCITHHPFSLLTTIYIQHTTHSHTTAMRRCSLLCRGALQPGGHGALTCRALPRLPRAFSTTTTPPQLELVRLRVDAQIANITLQNPAKLNPLTVKCRGRDWVGDGGSGMSGTSKAHHYSPFSSLRHCLTIHHNQKEELGAQFQTVVQEIAEDKCRDICCVVLTGAGKAFSVRVVGGEGEKVNGDKENTRQ